MQKIRLGNCGQNSRNSIDIDKLPASKLPKPVRVYDVDKKEKIGDFKTVSAASQFLGLQPWAVNTIIKNKSRNTTNKLGLTITCR